MKQIFLFVLIGLAKVGAAQEFRSNTTPLDSLSDVFPLNVGNEWNYGYNYRFDDLPGVLFLYLDTGYVNLRVMSKIVSTDSTRWLIREVGNHRTQTNGQAWTGPQVRVDTFEIVEFHIGNHLLYRKGETSTTRLSVLPFIPTLADTARVYRYAIVDSSGNKSFNSRETPTGVFFTFRFSRGVGLSSVRMFNGITGWPSFETNHVLRSSIITHVDSPPTALPSGYSLEQNYPNPFNPATTITFEMPKQAAVTLKVFDVLGREVSTLVASEMQAGSHSVRFDAIGLSSGIYFYKFQANSFVQVRKMSFVR